MYDIFLYPSKTCLLIVVVIMVFYLPVNAQDTKIDSLEKVVASKSGLDKYDPLIELIRLHANNYNNIAGLEIADRSYQLAMQFGDSAKIVRSMVIQGQFLNRMDRSKEAINVLSVCLKIAQRNKFRQDIKTILNNLALAYTVLANYQKALELNFETLLMREEDGDKPQITISLNNIGFVYFKLRNYKTALEYYNRALALKREINDQYEMANVLTNIGLCHNQLHSYEEAHRAFSEAFKACSDNCSSKTLIEAEFGLGVASYFLLDFSSAKYHLKRSYSLAKEAQNRRFEAENLMYLSHIYLNENKIDSAFHVLTQCEQIAVPNGYNELIMSTYREFATIYNQTGNFEKASFYQNKYITLKDSLISGELIDKLVKMQTNYAERENMKTIADKEVTIQRQRGLNIAILIIALLAALLVFVLFRGNREKRKVNLALSEAKTIIEDQNRQLLNSNYNLDKELKEKNTELEKANESLVRVNEELDNFIYKTSHDIRGPLASLKGMCNVALMDVKDQLALGYLKKLDITAEKLNTILTRLLIVNQINNSALGSERIDFVGIVNDVLQLEKKKGLPPRLKIKKRIDNNIEFNSDKEFVRIILENLIDNAIKFYNDSERINPFVDITVIEEDRYIKIKVVDNGIGIKEVHPDKIFQMFSRASERSETGGIGLYITKTAAEKLGGSVQLKTSSEGYTEFLVRLPLSPVLA